VDPGATTTVPTFTGDASSPFCTTLAEVDVAGVLGNQAGSPEAIAAGFANLITVLDELAGVAPGEVQADVELMAEGIRALDEALAQVQYDFDTLAAVPQAQAVADAINDPAFTVAGDRLEAYRSQVCHL
jgi:hypothetical protein